MNDQEKTPNPNTEDHTPADAQPITPSEENAADQETTDAEATIDTIEAEVVVEAVEAVATEEDTLELEAQPPTPAAQYDAPLDIWDNLGDDTDIDAALAAVASLGAADLDEEIFEDDLPYTPEAELATRAAPEVEITPAPNKRRREKQQKQPVDHYAPAMRLPPASTLKRGQLGSVIPALALIGVGAWLTITTTSGGTVDLSLLGLIGVGIVVLSLLAYSISMGRWTRGTIFFAALIALVGGVFVFTTQPLNLPVGFNLVTGYPLFVVALGLAMFISALLSRPLSRGAFAPGIVLLAAGIIGSAVTFGLVPSDILQFAAPLWFVPIVALVLIWMLPLVFRLRRQA